MQNLIGNAFLFEAEIQELVAVTKLPVHAFAESREPEHHVLKISNEGCVFYNDGKCQVYETRPFDCRLFPFDVKQRTDGQLVWIVYHDICHEKFNAWEYFETAKTLLEKMRPTRAELERYTKKKSLSSDRRRFLELGPVELY
jgi:Fe-S-cluster containining protein